MILVVAGCKGFRFKWFSLHVQYVIPYTWQFCWLWGKKGLGAGGDLVWILYRLQSVLYFSLGMPIGKVFFFFTAVQPGLKRSLWIALVLDSHNTGLIIWFFYLFKTWGLSAQSYGVSSAYGLPWCVFKLLVLEPTSMGFSFLGLLERLAEILFMKSKLCVRWGVPISASSILFVVW